MARPKIHVDPLEVEKLAGLNCSVEEIADFLGVSASYLYKSKGLSIAIKRGRTSVKTSLKRKQYEIALNGNTTMLIWLGKQYLGQADQSVTTVKEENLDAAIERELARMAAAEQAGVAGSHPSEK